MKRARTHLLAALWAISLGVASPASAQVHFTDCVSGTGSNASILLRAAVTPMAGGEPLSEGDEVAVFTSDGECAGRAVWEGRNVVITAWGRDELQVQGFDEGEALTYRVWRAAENKEYAQVAVDYSSAQRADGLYADDGLYVLSALAASQEVGSEEEPATTLLGTTPMWPNPTSGATTVTLTLQAPEEVAVAVYDALGRMVLSLGEVTYSAGEHDVRIDAGSLNSGLYVCRLRAGSFLASETFIVAR